MREKNEYCDTCGGLRGTCSGVFGCKGPAMTDPTSTLARVTKADVFPDGRCCRRTLKHEGEHMADRGYSIGHGLTYLECPCCGDDGAVSDGEGCFFDGQSLICGCPGWVSVDEDSEAWINNGDAPCPKCEARDNAQVSNRTNDR